MAHFRGFFDGTGETIIESCRMLLEKGGVVVDIAASTSLRLLCSCAEPSIVTLSARTTGGEGAEGARKGRDDVGVKQQKEHGRR